MSLVRTFRRCSAATTAIEFGLLAALIGLAVLGAASAVSDDLGGTFGRLAGSLGSVTAECDKSQDVMDLCR